TYLVVRQQLATATRIATVSTWADVLFGASIALVTEGANSPFYVFFAFAVLAAGFRAGLRRAMMVTGASVALYLSLILVSRPEGVNRADDELRASIRSLVDLGPPPAPPALGDGTRFSIRAHFDGSLLLVEHVLQIMLEGARNVRRHARADSAVITADAAGEKVRITIEDNGVGFAAGAAPPWSIASRAAELRGEVRVGRGAHAGGHVQIELPE